MKKILVNWVLKHLLCAVLEKEIMRIDTAGNVYLGGEKVTDQLAKELKQEANIMKELRLWNILTNTPKHQAKEVMFTKSKTFDDMMAGKMMLYTVDVQENIVNRLTRL